MTTDEQISDAEFIADLRRFRARLRPRDADLRLVGAPTEPKPVAEADVAVVIPIRGES